MDVVILYLVWIITVLLLVIFIKPINSIQAQVSFLFMQIPCWLFGAWVVQKGFIEYPVGFLKMIYKSSFTFEFFVFPETDHGLLNLFTSLVFQPLLQ